MSEAQELRVGICGCTPYFHGQLQGQRIMIRLSPTVERVFLIEEIVIPEEKQREALKENRCHCFIDVHPDFRDPSLFSVTLSLNKLVPHKGGKDYLYQAGYDGRSWGNVAVVPSPREMLAVIRAILQDNGLDRLEKWLAVMTPSGWTLKAEV